MRRPREFDVLGIVHALLAVERTESAWCDSVLDAAGRYLGRGVGVGRVAYDLSGAGNYELAARSLDEDWLAAARIFHTDEATAEHVKRGYSRADSVNLARLDALAALPEHIWAPYQRLMHASGIRDQWIVNGRIGSTQGFALYVFDAHEIQYSAQQRHDLARLSEYLGQALLLQRLTRASCDKIASAVFDASGRLLHAAPGLDPGGMARAAEAARARAWAFSGEGRESSSRALDTLAAHSKAGRNVVEIVDTDGKRFYLACQDRTIGLSRREQEVLDSALAGKTNKVIAFELGLSHSTVRVLLARAAAKHGVRTRDDLLRVAEKNVPG